MSIELLIAKVAVAAYEKVLSNMRAGYHKSKAARAHRKSAKRLGKTSQPPAVL